MIPQPPKHVTVEDIVDNISGSSLNASGDHEGDDEDCYYMDASADPYAWEAGYDKTWEELKEKDGLLDLTCFLNVSGKKKDQQTECSETPPQRPFLARKATLRNLVILLDASESMQETDYKPNRFYYCISVLEEILPEFFRVNPLCRVGIVAMLHRQAMPVSLLNSSITESIQILRELRERDISGGTLSLLKGFQKCCTMLTASPSYATREILLILSSLNTCDSGDIYKIIDEMVSQRIRIIIVSLSPALYVLQKAATMTGGNYSVVRTPEEFMESLGKIRHAADWGKQTETRLVPMGFPRQIHTTSETLCICHNRLSTTGYICPCCRAQVCTLPTKCRVCDLHLASFWDIARTTQHYATMMSQREMEPGNHKCFMCERDTNFSVVECTGCHHLFCSQCSAWKSLLLQQCPGCAVGQEVSKRKSVTS